MVTNEHLLNLIFFHLIKNAYMFQSPHRDSYLKIKVIELEGTVKFRFEDNGVGIPDSLQEKIYDLFFKASVISSGIGLGLYVTKAILKRINGNIELISNEEGSTFTITIPKKISGPREI